MTDNVTLPGTGAVVASDDVGGFQFQRVKVVHGADGTATDASSAAPLPVTAVQPGGATATRTQVADSAVEGQLLASNAARKLAKVYNDSTATLYLGEGATVVTSSNYTAQVPFGGFYETVFTGALRGVWSSDPGNGGAQITEVT